MKYLDANIFLYYLLNPESDKTRIAAKALLMKVADGSVHGATSVLTWDEIVWVVKKKVGFDIAKTEGSKFLEFPKLKLLDVNESVLSKSQALMEKYDLKPRDAIHAACCIENDIEEIITDDSDFDGIAGLKRIKLEHA